MGLQGILIHTDVRVILNQILVASVKCGDEIFMCKRPEMSDHLHKQCILNTTGCLVDLDKFAEDSGRSLTINNNSLIGWLHSLDIKRWMIGTISLMKTFKNTQGRQYWGLTMAVPHQKHFQQCIQNTTG